MWLRPARQPPDLHVVVSTNRRSRKATYPAVCSKRATPLGNADRANRKPRCGRNGSSGWMLSVRVFGPGGHDRTTAPEYFELMGVAHGPLRRCHSGKGRAVPERPPVDLSSLADQSGGIVMNTAVA